jgi:photosystem II stability/assembly factor-like uncharacterized protein
VAGGFETPIIDPTTPSTLYVLSPTSTSARTIFKSTNSGSTWTALTNTIGSSGLVNALAVDPITNTTLYAFTSGGVYKSTNGGTTWTLWNSTLTGSPPVLIDPTNTQVIYCGGSEAKSTDGGATWTSFSSGFSGGTVSINGLAFDLQNTQIIYAATSAGLSMSSNGGGSWSSVLASSGGCPSVAVDTINASNVYVMLSTGGILKSTDGGTSWSAANTGFPLGFGVCLSIDPVTPTTLYAGTSGTGVYKTTNGATSWSSSSTGTGAAVVSGFESAVAFDPVTTSNVYVATGAGIFKSTDGGSTWTGMNSGLSSFNATSVALAPSSPSTLYAVVNNQVFLSTNSGTSWSSASSGITNNVTWVVVDTVSASVAYAGGSTTSTPILWKTTNSGSSWTGLSSGLGTAGAANALAIDPASNSTLYLAAGDVFKSSDGGSTWAVADTGIPNGGSGVNVFWLSMGSAPGDIYVAGAASTFYVDVSTNGATSWTSAAIPSNPLVVRLVADPENGNVVYAGTLSSASPSVPGLSKTTNTGGAWASASSGLFALSSINPLAVSPTSSSVVFASCDGFLYRSTTGGQ